MVIRFTEYFDLLDAPQTTYSVDQRIETVKRAFIMQPGRDFSVLMANPHRLNGISELTGCEIFEKLNL